MRTVSLRLPFAVLAAVGVLALPSAASAVEPGPTPVPGTAAPAVDEVVERALPDEPGVDLAALGYTGPVIDAALVERMAATLPEDPTERVVELAHRIQLGPPLQEALAEASTVLGRAVIDFEGRVERLRSARAVADLQAAAAAKRLDEARSRAEERAEQLDVHRAHMAQVAVAAYVSPPDAKVLERVLSGEGTTSDDLTAGVLFGAKADHDGVVQDSLEVATAVAGEVLVAAVRTAQEAVARIERLQAELADVEQRRDALRRAAGSIDGALEVVELHLPGFQPELDATIQSSWPISDLPGMEGIDVPLVSVAGITVHAGIAPNLQALLVAAHADGVMLAGWGHRTIARQIELRRQHCGPTPEDIYAKPASACSPPTAQPGSSLHERGLAIDFHLAGQSISTRSSPGYQWLAENAATYGFYNLPSEPWHWSTTGG